MNYKSKGSLLVPGCTPAPMTVFDNRSCRERTGCTREECIPKKLKCDWCGIMESRLNVLEEIESGNDVYLCTKCKETIKDNIVYGDLPKPPKIDAGNRFA